MGKTIHFSDKTKSVNISSSVTSLGEEISFDIGDFSINIITDNSDESIEVLINRQEAEPQEEPME